MQRTKEGRHQQVTACLTFGCLHARSGLCLRHYYSQAWRERPFHQECSVEQRFELACLPVPVLLHGELHM